MRRLWLLLLLSACAAPPEQLLLPCRPATIPPQPPAAGHRTIQSLAAWTSSLQLAREATDDALAECSARQAALVQWVKEHRHE